MKRSCKKFKQGVMLLLSTLSVIMMMTGLVNTYVKIDDNAQEMQEEILSEVDIQAEKLQQIAQEYENVPELKGKEREALERKITQVDNSNLDATVKKEALEALGFVDVYDNEVSYASTSGNATVNKPTISYNASLKRYSIIGTGGLHPSYVSDEFSFWKVPSVGTTKNLGKVDVVGLSISNVKGNTTNIECIAGAANFLGKGVTGSTVLITDNDVYGVAYQLQDKITIASVRNYILWFNYTYYFNASSIRCSAAYSKELANCSGSVKFVYVHTWDSAKVDSVELSNDGVSVSISNSEDSWRALSYGTLLP